VSGGLLFATPLTLVLVPAIYSVFEQFADVAKESLKPKNIIKTFRKLWNSSVAKFKRTNPPNPLC